MFEQSKNPVDFFDLKCVSVFNSKISTFGRAIFMGFGTFSKMVGTLPPEAIIGALDLECKMILDDRLHSRLAEDEGSLSLLYFDQFVKMVKVGGSIRRFRGLPPDHLEFYRETILRLIDAKELPASAMDQFDRAFAVF